VPPPRSEAAKEAAAQARAGAPGEAAGSSEHGAADA
jgi:hypothetical protein